MQPCPYGHYQAYEEQRPKNHADSKSGFSNEYSGTCNSQTVSVVEEFEKRGLSTEIKPTV